MNKLSILRQTKSIREMFSGIIEEYIEMCDNELISFDEELEAYSCCVELHRKGKIRIH